VTLRISFCSFYVRFLEVVRLIYMMTFFQLWKLWACRIARVWKVFIDLESGVLGKAVVEILAKLQNLHDIRQNGQH
jgi:hypothetical protein